MAQGPMVWFDWSLLKTWDQTIKLSTDTFKMVICTNAQAISRSFVGGSGDARYADLTAEFTTANGYTVGGVTMSGLALARVAANQVKWSGTPPAWTITGAGLVSAKYAIIYNDTHANKPLVGFTDFDTGGGVVNIAAGSVAIAPDGTLGFLYGEQP